MTSTPESVQQDLNSADFGDRLRGVNALRGLDPAVAFEMILPILTDPHVRVRYAAISQMDTLGHVNKEKSLEILRDRLNHDPEIDNQAAAADAMGALQLTEGFEDLKQAYEGTNDWMLKMSIVAGLGALGDDRGLELLIDATTSTEPLVQMAGISALGDLGNPDAIPVLLPFVSHEDWQTRQRLVQALSQFSTPETQKALETLAQDPMEPVSNFAKSCLEAMG